MSTESPPVCQIPDCTTTQAEIEVELSTFLASFCSVCKKDRGGKLCGCAFPCSLTFKSQMLNKIQFGLVIVCFAPSFICLLDKDPDAHLERITADNIFPMNPSRDMPAI